MFVAGILPAWLAPAAATSITAVSTAAPEATFRLGTRLVDGERTTAHLVLIELRRGLLGFFVGGHFNEREAARPARGSVAHHTDRLHGACAAKELLELRFARGVWKVS